MSDSYNKIIALIREQGRGNSESAAFCGVVANIKPLKLRIMEYEVENVILASEMKCTEEDLGRRILCVPCDAGLIGVCFI